MKKSKLTTVMALILIAAMMLAGCGSSASTSTNSDSTSASSSNTDTATGSTDTASVANDGQTYTFKIDYPNPENSCAYVCLTEWSDMLREQSNGQLDFQICANGQLGGIADCVSNCVGGLTDGFWSAMTIYAGLYRPAEALTLPMMGVKTGDVGSAVLTAMLGETDYYTESLSNLYVVTLHSSTPMPVGFKDSKEINSVADMAGLNMRVTGGYNSNWVTAIGCNPVSVGSNDGYEYLEKGIINSYLYDWDKIESSALLEQTGYIIDGQVSASELLFCLNKDKYNALPDELKALIDDSAQWFRDRICELYDDQADRMIAQAESMNIPVVPISDELNAEFAAAAEDVWQAWIEEMNAAGYDGQGIFDKTREYIDYYNELLAD